MLVRREVPVAGLSLDHLFVDQDAIPTLIETKRGEDTRGRRDVVAQMLDYAANAAIQWKAELLREVHAERCRAALALMLLTTLLHEQALGSMDDFWVRASGEPPRRERHHLRSDSIP